MRSPGVEADVYSTVNLAFQISKLKWMERCLFACLLQLTILMMFFERGTFCKGPAVY